LQRPGKIARQIQRKRLRVRPFHSRESLWILGGVMDLERKIAIITGAGRGIGKAIALSMAKEGAIPVIVDIDEASAEQAVKEVQGLGVSTMRVRADVSKTSELKEMARTVVRNFETIDILVNNAGLLETTLIEDVTEVEWDRIMAVNLKGVFFASQQVIPYMKKKGWGRIINLSSLAGRMGGYGNGCIYAASKAGIIGLTMSLARKLAEYNITVNAVAPGTTETEMIQGLSEERLAMLRATIPLKRLGKPQNIADIVVFLASDASEFMTGAVIDVNGGLFMG
jgi:3-oxoacyl-[acyl-carrier protein] reductase